MTSMITAKALIKSIQNIDDELSKRFIRLDPNGYFIIKLDLKANEIIVEHFTNDLDSEGRALDPETGEPISCSGGSQRIPKKTLRGRTAKEIGIRLTESDDEKFISRLDHALYLGRELQKAETCLIKHQQYIQD